MLYNIRCFKKKLRLLNFFKVLSSTANSQKNIFHLLDFVLKKSVLLQSEKIEINFNLNLKNVRNCRNRRATIQSKQR